MENHPLGPRGGFRLQRPGLFHSERSGHRRDSDRLSGLRLGFFPGMPPIRREKMHEDNHLLRRRQGNRRDARAAWYAPSIRSQVPQVEHVLPGEIRLRRQEKATGFRGLDQPGVREGDRHLKQPSVKRSDSLSGQHPILHHDDTIADVPDLRAMRHDDQRNSFLGV